MLRSAPLACAHDYEPDARDAYVQRIFAALPARRDLPLSQRRLQHAPLDPMMISDHTNRY